MKLTHYTGGLKILIYGCILYLYLALIEQNGVISKKPSIRNESVMLGGNITFGLNASKYETVAWVHNSSKIILHWSAGKKMSTKSNVRSETPTWLTISDAQINDSGLYTLMILTNLSSTTYFFLNVNGTSVST
ncbi:glycoprotein vIgFam3 [Elephant endotheliotropic herpesvirus 2]|nr:glycoprotein vIgFam3 [Elephant endotheliotropic herpesvirus 2]